MNRLFPALWFLVFGMAFVPIAHSQDSLSGVDLLYPEFAHPQQDAALAIKRSDFRFITIDRHGKVVPGTERYPRLVEIHGKKFIKQPFRILATTSQNFSFALRARAYADQYNQALLSYLLARKRSR